MLYMLVNMTLKGWGINFLVKISLVKVNWLVKVKRNTKAATLPTNDFISASIE